MRHALALALVLLAGCGGGKQAAAPRVRVPTLTGLTERRALERLAAASLCPGEVVRRESPLPTNRVSGQQPRPGARVAAGTEVDLVVSSRPGPVGVTEQANYVCTSG